MSRLDARGTTLALGVILPLALFLGLVLRPGLDATPPGIAPAPPALTEAQRLLRFLTDEDGTIRVEDASDGRLLRTFEAGDGGFLRGALRPLERERDRHGASRLDPYLLSRTPDGGLFLRDPASDLSMDVAAFGRTSVEIFGALLPGGPGPSGSPSYDSPASMEDRP